MAAKKKHATRRRRKVIAVDSLPAFDEQTLAEAPASKRVSKRERELAEAYERGRNYGWHDAEQSFERRQREAQAKHREEMREAQKNILVQLSYMMQHNANFMEGASRVVDRLVPRQ